MSTYKLSQSKGPSTRALSAPTVPAAIANGGLGWADLQDPASPVSVQVVLAPDTVFINDRIDLYWQEVAVATTTVKQEQLDVGVVTLPVLPRDILEHDDGPHILYYIATATIGGGTSPSRDATVEVKRLIPGGYDSDAGTEYINENLAAPTGIPELIDDAMAEVGITVTVVAYQNMAAGDRLKLDWGGQRLLHEPLVDAQVGQSVTFLVTKDTLVAAPGPVVVRYEVRDKVNNWSKWSLSAQTDVEAGGDLLAAPRVVDAVGGIIDLAVLGEKDAHVQTPPYPDMESGDSVVLTWQGETAEGVAIPVIQNHDVLGDEVGWPLDFYIPNDKVRTIAQGQAVSTYKVIPATGQPIPSRRTTTRVIGKAALLPAPTVQGAVGGVLDPSDLPSTGATLTILPSDLIKPGNFISLLWEGVTSSGTSFPYHDDFPVTGSMEGGPIDRPIPLANITPLLNGTATASFILMKDGAQLPSDSQVVQIKSQDAYLPKPSIDFAEGDTLDPANVPASGTTVRINYAPMLTDDRVDVHWDGLLDYTDYFPVPAGWGNKEVSFAISKNYVDLNKDQTVQVFYTVTREGVLLPASIKQPLLIGSALDLPVPSVKEAVGNSLEPIAAKDRLTVVVPHYNGMLGTDELTVTWTGTAGEGSYTSPTPIPVGTVGIKEIEIPNSVVAFNLNSPVTVSYNVIRGVDSKPSESFSLAVQPISDNDEDLAGLAKITQVVDGVLNLSTFTGDATFRCDKWPLMAAGQCVWLRLIGTQEDGASHVITLWTASVVNEAELENGYVSKAIPRDQLELFQGDSEVKVEYKVNFNKLSDESRAVSFPVPDVKMGVRTIFEDFGNTAQDLIPGRPIYLSTAVLTVVKLYGPDTSIPVSQLTPIGGSGNDGIALYINSMGTNKYDTQPKEISVTIELNTSARKLHFNLYMDVYPHADPYSVVTISYYGEQNNLLYADAKPQNPTGWREYEAPVNSKIKRLILRCASPLPHPPQIYGADAVISMDNMTITP